MNKKTIAIFAVCMVLVCALSVFTTLALLQDQTDVITNTFTSGNVDIELYESDKDDNTIVANLNASNAYKFIPNSIHDKNPTIVLKDGSESAYIALKVDFANFPSKNTTNVDLVSEYIYGIAPDATVYSLGALTEAKVGDVTLYSGSYVIYFNQAKNASSDATAITGVQGATYEVFDQVKIPDFGNTEINAVNSKNGASIKVSAYAVQSENTTGGALAALQATFNELEPAAQN